MKTSRPLVLLLAGALGLAVGCRPLTPPSVYVPATEEGLATPGVDMHDYDLVLARMVRSMLSRIDPAGGRPPVVTFGPVVNRTPYQIETHMILEDIRVEALRSGLVRFSAATDYRQRGGEAGQIYQQLEFQVESGHVDPATIKHYGQIVGADYILHGNIYDIERRAPGLVEANYNFILTMHEVATGLVVWSESARLRKNLRP